MKSIHEHNCCDHATAPVTDAQPSLAVNVSVLVLRIDKMDCPTEESLLRKSLELVRPELDVRRQKKG